MPLPKTDITNFFTKVSLRESGRFGRPEIPQAAAAESARVLTASLTPLLGAEFVFESDAPGMAVYTAKTPAHTIKVEDKAPEQTPGDFDRYSTDENDPFVFSRVITIYETDKGYWSRGCVTVFLRADAYPHVAVHMEDRVTCRSTGIAPEYKDPDTRNAVQLVDTLTRKINAAAPVSEWVRTFNENYETAQDGLIYARGKTPPRYNQG